MSTIASDNLRIVEIERIACPNPADFLSRIVARRKPAVVTDLVTQWPAYGRWTPQYFKERFPNARCRVAVNLPTRGTTYETAASTHLREMSLPDFIDYMSASPPCYYRRQHAHKFQGLDEDVGFAQLTPGYRADSDFLWIGSAGTRTGLHFDTQDNVLCQLFGSKELWLAAPQDSTFLHVYPASITKSRVAPDQPDFERFPSLKNVIFHHCFLNAGEAIYIPNRWWHSVVSTSVSISANHEFGKKTSWGGLASAISACGLRGWATVARDFVRYGVFSRPFERRLADDPPFGRVVYDLIADSVRRVPGKARNA